MKAQLLSNEELKKQVDSIREKIEWYKVSVKRAGDSWEAQTGDITSLSTEMNRAVYEAILMRYRAECESDLKPVDWFKIINDLENTKLDRIDIAKAVGAGKSTVTEWRSLKFNPKYAQGERLVDLWIRRTGKDRKSLPRLK